MLLVLVFLPRHFSIQQTSDLRGSDEQVRPLLFDLKLWPQLMAWDKFSSKLSIDISSPSNTLGANVFLHTSSADIEITITEISQSQLQYSILINNEHALLGSLSLIHNDNELKELLQELNNERKNLNTITPIALKISPDIHDKEI